MNKTRIALALLPAFLLAACGTMDKNAVGTGEAVHLASKYIEGEKYTVHLDWNEKISSTDSTGSTHVQEIKMEREMDYLVQKVDAARRATLALQFVSLKTNGFDSKDSTTYSDTATAELFREMSRYRVAVQLDTLGNVLKVTGAEGVFSSGIKDSPLNDNQIMREMEQNSLGIFPGKLVRVGDSWEKKNTISYGYPGIYQHTYTLKEVKEGRAIIEVRTEIKPNLTAPPTYFPGNIMVRMELYGSQSGTIEVDIEKGRIMKTEITLKVSGKAHGTFDGEGFENVMSTELTTKTESKWSLK